MEKLGKRGKGVSSYWMIGGYWNLEEETLDSTTSRTGFERG
jgi:hypothetical protein